MPATVRFPSPDSQGLATGLADLKMSDLPGPRPHFAQYDEIYDIPQNLSNRELWKLYHFEKHAVECSYCYDPYRVHRRDGRLCREGHRLAQAVAATIYSEDDAARLYSSSTTAGHRQVAVEIPTGYDQVISLLRAMERSLRHRSQAPIVSLDRTYYVTERPVDRRTSVRRTRETSPRRDRITRRQDDPRRSNLVIHESPEEEQEQAGPSSQQTAAQRATNYTPPSVEDADEEGNVTATKEPNVPVARTTRPRPHSMAATVPVETRVENPANVAQREPGSRNQNPSPRRQATGPPPAVLPAAPEPPVRSERSAPTDFAYNTTVRQPPAVNRQPSSSSSRRRSGFWR